MAKITFTGTKLEQDVFTQVIRHYSLAEQDLTKRTEDFNKRDELFRSYIDESNWPYQSVVFDPRIFTAIFEKTARLFARKPKGRLVPREGGDSLGARISNELLSFQWDDNERVDATPMLAKWSLMDQNARKYGAAFALCKWHYETKPDKKKKQRDVYYDGPNFKVWNNRDVLVDPSYSTIKNWAQLRDYVTLQELESVNDVAKGKPVYKNLDILKRKIKEGQARGGDTRSSNYQVKNLTIQGLTDMRGRDEVFKTIEIITEYRKDRWITFAPKHGVVIRDIDNPYDHGQIPVVMLKYYPVDDDIYGLSEMEPVERLQRAINALVCQYIDAINMGLYPISKVRSTGVQMHTLEYDMGAKWIMDDPNNVVPHEHSLAGVSEFTSTYRFLVSALNEALGETSAGVSNSVPGSPDKTATEIKDTALQRNARDNFNQIFLAEALKKQMMFWHTMNSQFMFGNGEGKAKVIRIVGKDAIQFFEKQGLSGTQIPQEALDMLQTPEGMELGINPQEFDGENLYNVNVDGEDLPKFTVSPQGDVGFLLLEQDDLAGNYDYIPDIESMSIPDDRDVLFATKQLVEIATNPTTQQQLGQEGFSIKIKDVLEDFLEKQGLKDAEKYFEKLRPELQGGLNVQGINPAGAASAAAGQKGAGANPTPGMAGGITSLAGNQNQALVG